MGEIATNRMFPVCDLTNPRLQIWRSIILVLHKNILVSYSYQMISFIAFFWYYLDRSSRGLFLWRKQSILCIVLKCTNWLDSAIWLWLIKMGNFTFNIWNWIVCYAMEKSRWDVYIVSILICFIHILSCTCKLLITVICVF